MQAGRLRTRYTCITVVPIRVMVLLKRKLHNVLPFSSRLLAGGCVALVALLAILAASPALHEWLHKDAGDADHECAVTLFLHGLEDAAAAVTAVAVIWKVAASGILMPVGPDLDRRRDWLPPGNAPPALD